VRLDYNASSGAFLLRVQRTEADVAKIMEETGLDLSDPASTNATAVLFTHEPYAAAQFAEYASERARSELTPLLREIDASWAPEDTGHYKVPYDKELWGFQKADLAYALRRRNTLIGDEPGLGKTQVAIAFANETGAKRILVMVPASIRLQWVKRIREWTTMAYPYTIHPVMASRNGVNPHANWTIVSYDLARTEAIGRALASGSYDLLILDEGHYLKTIDSRRTRAVFGGGDTPLFEPIAHRAGSILALTGTPLPNRPREAYTLARGLNFDSIDWMSEDKFNERFNPSQKMERFDPVTGSTRVWIDERSGRHGELQARLRANLMVRHLKRDVMTQLKLPIYDLIQLEETGPIKSALQAESLLDIDPESLEGADAVILGEVATVRRMMGVAMAPSVADHIKMLIDGGETKLVLFAWHTEVLDILMRDLAQYNPVRVDGSTSSSQKERRVRTFIMDPKCDIIIGNVLSLGTGTDGLQQVSNHGLIAEPDWVPGNNIQCFDRLDRGGQREQVQGDIFVVPNSIAERVLASALRKLQITNKALDRRGI
jgi:SWI/SNF-related matrix-associated actin-dependent regulator 1 of chromatin subfamily A